jgi:hypothetical protein
MEEGTRTDVIRQLASTSDSRPSWVPKLDPAAQLRAERV